MTIVKKIEKGAIILAPMAGITDSAFRRLCISEGADIVYSEMISLQALYYNDKKTKMLMKHYKEEMPFVLQVFGENGDIAEKVVREQINNCEDIDAIDINMGCPAPKIVKNGSGSALMKEPKKALKLIEKIVKVSKYPVSVKLRLGWDDSILTAREISLGAQELGVKWIAVHGRTREQYYSGKANWNSLKALNEELSIPFIANGDIFTPEDAKRAIDYIGTKSLMIGRGAQGNPWIFNQIKDYLLSGEYKKIEPKIKLNMSRKHINLLSNELGDKIAIREMRKHLSWYFKGLYMAAEMRNTVNRLDSKEEVLKLLDNYEQLLGERLDK